MIEIGPVLGKAIMWIAFFAFLIVIAYFISKE